MDINNNRDIILIVIFLRGKKLIQLHAKKEIHHIFKVFLSSELDFAVQGEWEREVYKHNYTSETKIIIHH